MDSVRAVVERITFYNEKNGYAVLKCRAKGFSDLVTVVGSMADINVGSVLSMTGEWKVDSKYGRQLSIISYEETLPATVYGIEKYLGSGFVKGIGPHFASKIVREFGEKTLEVIETDPDQLIKVQGIGRKRVERIKKSWIEQKEIKNIMLFLQEHDVSTSHATKIWKQYGNEAISVVTENPYRLADDIWGIGFKTADTIASKLGFGKDRYERLRSGLMYTLNKLSEEGHCYASREMLIDTGIKLLDVESELLSDALDQMIHSEDVFTDRDEELEVAIYLPPFFHSEKGTAKRLGEIYNTPGSVTGCQPVLNSGIEYDPVQIEAIRTALNSKITVLTGGPGTGKTTTTLGIITAFRSAGANILLAAPTGRAAKRLSEATGLEAKTIHRLLEYKPPEGYQRNDENKLSGDVLILDECSMIDILLMYNLLKAVPDSMTVIFVGDIDQLPSVGAGNVLRDIIDSGVFPVVRLTKIFRQAATSRIITNAHRINQGQMPDLRNRKNTDFFFIQRDEPDDALTEITELVKTKLPRHYHLPIQVLTPMQRGSVGAANLNQVLQEAVNPGSDGLRRGGVEYRTGDKVMQIRNNYDKEVFNGDIGMITAVDQTERELTVDYDGRNIKYDISELDELVLAYATTIHKSQGSEYPIVVIPVTMSHYMMLQRNLLYTGVTRAKKACILVGSYKAIALAVKNLKVYKRNTLLAERIKSYNTLQISGG